MGRSLKNYLCKLWHFFFFSPAFCIENTNIHKEKWITVVDVFHSFTKQNPYKSDLDSIWIFIRYRGNFDILQTQPEKRPKEKHTKKPHTNSQQNVINFIVFYFRFT